LCWNRCSRTFKTKLSRSPNCSLRINKASHLDHVAPIVNFSIYSVELELLSLTCPGLDLGSVILHCYLVTLVTVMVMLILLVCRIGFGVTGIELIGVMPTDQGFVRGDMGIL
jgi:hypothetical protein